MSKNTSPAVTDLDYDLASLDEPHTADELATLDAVLDARDALDELRFHLAVAQRALERHEFDLAARDRIGADMLALAEILKASALTVFDGGDA